MRQIREVLRLRHEKGLSPRVIAAACGLGVGTVSEHLGRAARVGLKWPLPAEMEDAGLQARLFPRSEPGRQRVPPDLVRVHEELKRPGVTSPALGGIPGGPCRRLRVQPVLRDLP